MHIPWTAIDSEMSPVLRPLSMPERSFFAFSKHPLWPIQAMLAVLVLRPFGSRVGDWQHAVSLGSLDVAFS